jgi:hypothetical protein
LEQRRQQQLQQERQRSEEPLQPQPGEAISEGLQQQRQPLAALPVQAVAPSIAGQVSALPDSAPAAASVLGRGSSGGEGGSGSIALRAAEVRQRRVQDAITAFEASDCSAKSMLRPLVMLRQAGHGGQVLQVC